MAARSRDGAGVGHPAPASISTTMNTRITSYCQVVTFGSSDMMEDAKEKEEKEEEEEEEEEEEKGGG